MVRQCKLKDPVAGPPRHTALEDPHLPEGSAYLHSIDAYPDVGHTSRCHVPLVMTARPTRICLRR